MARPSRLLNLNKSNASNKQITKTNAKRSPLLSLPPELRSRIYGYVFSVGVIHIIWHRPIQSTDLRHRLSVCDCPGAHEGVQSRLALGPSSADDVPQCMQSDQVYISPARNNTRKPFDQYFHLDLLQTCRQIYHEAVLILFAVNYFRYIVLRGGNDLGLHCLLENMVPTQVRAIKHLRLVSTDTYFPRRIIIQQLKRLEQVDVQLVLSEFFASHWCRFDEDFWKVLEVFPGRAGVEALSKLPLKSLHIALEMKLAHSVSAKPDMTAIDSWLKALEAKLTKPTVDQVGAVSATGL